MVIVVPTNHDAEEFADARNISPPSLDIGIAPPVHKRPNAKHQARREAGAQRTLLAVVCMPFSAQDLAGTWRFPIAA